jgi:hypothetical protein
MKPNSVGKKHLYFNPGTAVSFNTTELAAIDSTLGNAPESLYPYAYTATVRDDYDTMNFSTGSYNVSDVAAQRNLAWGVFLSPENDKKNLLFQASGVLDLQCDSALDDYMQCGFFFGRTASSVITSTKAATANQLAKGIWLPGHSSVTVGGFTGQPRYMSIGFEGEIFSYYLNGGYNYCFGVWVQNPGAAVGSVSLKGTISLRKYSTELGVFRPSTA